MEAVNEIYAAAKEATIELLKAQGEKCFVVNFEKKFWGYTDNACSIECSAVGLDKDGELIIGGTIFFEESVGNVYVSDYFDPDFEDVYFTDYSYPALYDYVASHLPEDAVTREKAETMLKKYANDHNTDFKGEDDDFED